MKTGIPFENFLMSLIQEDIYPSLPLKIPLTRCNGIAQDAHIAIKKLQISQKAQRITPDYMYYTAGVYFDSRTLLQTGKPLFAGLSGLSAALRRLQRSANCSYLSGLHLRIAHGFTIRFTSIFVSAFIKRFFKKILTFDIAHGILYKQEAKL